MTLRERPIALWAMPALVLAGMLLLLGTDAGGIATGLRGILFDAYQHSQPRTYVDTRAHSGFAVRTLDADKASLTRFGPWPWSHATLALIARELKAQGAAMAVFAFPLEGVDPASPKNLLGQVPPGPDADAIRTALSQMPSADDDLRLAMSRLASITGFTLGKESGHAPFVRAPLRFIGTKNPFAYVPNFTTAAGALPALEQTSLGIGALNLAFDADGKVRRMPLAFRLNGVPVPSLTAEILRVIQNRRLLQLRSNEGDTGLIGAAPGVASVEAVNTDVPTAPDGSIWIAYSGDKPERRIAVSALMAHTVSAARLANAVVIVAPPGSSIDTPDGTRTMGAIYAESLENILMGTPLRRPASAIEAELICLAIFGAAAIILFIRFGVVWSGLFTAISIGGAMFVSWHLYSVDRVLFDSLGPSIALGWTFATAAMMRSFSVGSARARVRTAFADSLPPNVIEQIARRPELLKLDGVSRTVTYLHCGVREFRGLAESFKDDPAAFTRLMQRVLVPLMDVALARGGTIDRLTADGFSAFWNAPLDDPEHAIHACEAANGMMEAIARTNEVITHERRNDGVAFAPVEIGIGIATSQAIAGGFSAHGRTAYSVTGDCAVEAGRIQELSAQYGPAVIVADVTRKAAERGFAFLEVDYIAAGAHDEPMKLYAMLGSPVMRASPKFRALLTFHDHIFQSVRAQQWDKARELIEQCRKLSGASQKLYDLHLARIDYFQDSPPPADWDGAFRPILR
ncbi:MAG: adenylate/guanylate cyclase domain-containing protein [Alphaproteobacteria bacterium]|nr:adenylate/guanylate cyclase domain-containing protein [Alphaproteobacteria bacterium]